MTQQEIIDRDIRMLVGDLNVQLVFARARISELEQQLGEVLAKEKQVKPNGKDKREVEYPPT